jgi:hypothetical protein
MVLRIFELIAGRRQEYVNERAFLPSIAASKSGMHGEKNSPCMPHVICDPISQKKTAREGGSHEVMG